MLNQLKYAFSDTCMEEDWLSENDDTPQINKIANTIFKYLTILNKHD